jgi:flagellar basal-body rod protein FlgC
MDALFSALDISGSGCAAERLRMEVVANNIANAFSTRTPDGGPFRRKEVVFSAVLNHQFGSQAGTSPYGGVKTDGIIDDTSDFIRVSQPGHPDADSDGMVSLPNVQLPVEMVNLMTASRAYEANVKAAQSFQKMMEQSLTLMKG